MRVLLLTHFYAPERGAPQTRLRETARELTRLGHDVRVVTGPPHYPDGLVRPGYRWWAPSAELIDGLPVRRLPMLPRPNRGLVDRTVDQGTFALAAIAAAGAARWSDVVLVESPPLFLGITAAWYRLGLRRPYVYHVADPWPDFPIAMGALHNPLARRLAFAMEDLAYRHASLVTTVTPGLVERLERKRSARGKVRLVPNAVDMARFAPDRSPGEARRALGWTEARLTLVYAGSVGLAQGLQTLIDAVAPLEDDGIVVHVVGEGYEHARLEFDVADRGLGHVHFDGPVGAAAIPDVLAAADGVVVLLRAGPLYEESLPTKLLEGLAAGRPIVLSAGGEAARIVGLAGAGIVVRPESPEDLRAGIRSLAELTDRAAMATAARQAAARYDRRLIVGQLAEYLAEAVTPRSGSA